MAFRLIFPSSSASLAHLVLPHRLLPLLSLSLYAAVINHLNHPPPTPTPTKTPTNASPLFLSLPSVLSIIYLLSISACRTSSPTATSRYNSRTTCTSNTSTTTTTPSSPIRATSRATPRPSTIRCRQTRCPPLRRVNSLQFRRLLPLPPAAAALTAQPSPNPNTSAACAPCET